jgi:hypothetical protein
MSANFLDKGGWMVGSVDLHMFLTPGPANVPVPAFAVYFVVCPHRAASRSWRIAHSVTTEGKATLQNNWSMLIVPHIALGVLPPHAAAQPPNAMLVTLGGTAAPTMSVHSVTGEKQALLTALAGFFGFNLDCGLPSLPSGLDFNPNSVKTSPTLGDYIGSFVGMVLNAWYTDVIGALTLPLKTPWWASLVIGAIQNLLDFLDAKNVWILCDPVVYVINWITGKIQGWIDGGSAPSALGY